MYSKDLAVSRFRELLKYETVAGNESEFMMFRETLKKLYPSVIQNCKFEIIGKGGILLRWKGKQNTKQSDSIILMSHYDVVPADGGRWKYPPFSGISADGKIWGRGTLDTKGTLCAIMESVNSQIENGFIPQSDLYICFGGDEETTGNDAIAIASELQQRGVKPYLILDEGGAVLNGGVVGINSPCALVGIAEKGYMDVEFTAYGRGGHSSLSGAENPLTVIAEVIMRINHMKWKPCISESLKIMIESASGYARFGYRQIIREYRLLSKLFGKILIKKLPEIRALTCTVGAITQIIGGSAENIIPEKVCAVGNFRVVSGSSVNETLTLIRKELSGLNVEIRLICGLEPTVISPTSGRGWEILSAAITQTWQNSAMIPYLMLARSDSRSYDVISNNIYRFSPITMTETERASIHGVNENISYENYYRMIDFYISLIFNV